jgi:pyruvate formate lyase activating enzyme
MTDLPRTPATTLKRARDIAKSVGLKHVYTGNVHDVTSQSSYCAGCGELLIERDWYQLGEWSLTPNGNCRFCNESLVGHFETQPGTWGAKRERIAV